MKHPAVFERSSFTAAFLAAAALALSAGVPAFAAGSGRQASAAPDLGQMERELLSVLNRERAGRGLSVLHLSPAIVDLARGQSADMARLDVLRHTSATGKSFADRLFDAGVPYAANGENVARVGAPVAGLIHQSFMASPGHRANILNPDFDEVGISIVPGPENAFFVTEDFIMSLVRKPDAEVRALILGVLNKARAGEKLPPVVLLDEADRTAGVFAGVNAAEREPPPVPAYFGQALVRLAVGPDLGMIAAAIKGQELALYGRAGIGVAFGRSSDYPGGAYFLCVLLIRDRAGAEPDELDRLLTVLRAADGVRARKKLGRLELDPDLSRRADEVIARRRKGVAADASDQARGDVFFAMFQGLDRIDDSLRKRLEDPGLQRIGIATLPIQTPDGARLQYAVAVILGR
jgi:uncharacterized protein YkwD